MIHLTFQELDEISQKFDLKLVQQLIAGTTGNYPAGAVSKFVFHRPEAEIVMTLDITNYPKNDRILPPGQYLKESFDPRRGFHEEGQAVTIELTILINQMWQAKLSGTLPTGKVTHEDFSKTLFSMIQPFMVAPKALDSLWSMFEDNPHLIEPNSPKNKKPRAKPR